MSRQEALRLRAEALRRLPRHPQYDKVTGLKSEESYSTRPIYRFDLHARATGLKAPVRSRGDLDIYLPRR